MEAIGLLKGGVYPRMRGGTALRSGMNLPFVGLSPHARGNLPQA